MQIEICTNSYHSVKNAVSQGINRIELCQALELGGLTPSAALIHKTLELKTQYNFDCYVLIRPRSGDFVYNDDELKLMQSNIEFCKKSGVDGFVIGALQHDGSLDSKTIDVLLDSAKEMGLTFHRAFDLLTNPFEALEKIIEWGFDRILSSGQASSAIEGAAFLKQLVNHANGRIDIMAGAGINAANVLDLIKISGVDAVHFSAKETIRSRFQNDQNGLFEQDYWLTSEQKVKKIVELLK